MLWREERNCTTSQSIYCHVCFEYLSLKSTGNSDSRISKISYIVVTNSKFCSWTNLAASLHAVICKVAPLELLSSFLNNMEALFLSNLIVQSLKTFSNCQYCQNLLFRASMTWHQKPINQSCQNFLLSSINPPFLLLAFLLLILE